MSLVDSHNYKGEEVNNQSAADKANLAVIKKEK